MRSLMYFTDMRLLLLFVVFWAFQLLAYAIFKIGSTHREWFVLCFVLGNLFGASCMWLLMRMFQQMNPNLAMVLTTGGSFVLIQLLMVLAFHSRPTLVQWLGIAAVCIGMSVATLAAPQTGATETKPSTAVVAPAEVGQ